MPRLLIYFLLYGLLLTGCRNTPIDETLTTVDAPALLPAPDEVYGELFEAIQMEQVFADGKTFVDCTPKQAPEIIMEAYRVESQEPDFVLRNFVLEYFETPAIYTGGFESDTSQTTAEHINRLWDVLAREKDETVVGSSLIPLPESYIVPGGRFREVYYWDSYFTMLGLKQSGRIERIEDMLDNFAYLIEQVGFIPNGNRTYYKGRSQPPFFASMVRLLASTDEGSGYARYLPALEREYAFWMEGQEDLTPDNPAYRQVVRLPEGTVLNRYWDRFDTPRPESYREDVELMRESGREPSDIYRDLRAGAASGWDYSARWFEDGKTFATIRTTKILPVCQNALLYNLETLLAEIYTSQGETAKADRMTAAATARKAAVLEHHWDEEQGFFYDYDFEKQQRTGIAVLAGMYPLYYNMATPEQAAKVAAFVEANFLKPGGVTTSLYNSGQQWDAPNGWAPLQWMTIKGLRNYGYNALAQTIEDRWLARNESVFKETGKMMEKYNVEDLSVSAGGGEYPNQDGFGWTNGVYLQLKFD